MTLKRTIQPFTTTADPEARRFMADVAENFDTRRVSTVVTASAESANVVTVTIQVTDRLRRDPISGRWLLFVIVSTTEFGAPGGTQTVAVTTGTLIENTGSQLLSVLTDNTGTAVLTITIAGAATRYVTVANLEEATGSGVLTWTA